MKIAVIVISVALALGLIAQFTVTGIKRHKERLAQGLERQTFKEWWQTHKPSKRRLIQIYAAILFNAHLKGYITGNELEAIYDGNTKYMCAPGLNCYSCPGAVGACPLGALQNALGESDHRAPFYMLGILALFGLVLARTICGFLCPTGLLQDLLYKIRTPKLKKSKVTRVLSYFKYVLLIVLVIALPLIYGALPAFCKYICPAGTFGGAIGLLTNPTNDSIFANLGPAFTWKFCVLVVIAVLCVFIYRFFCRFICPLGAIYGFFNRIALMGVKLDSGKCTDCGLCIQHCKMDIRKVGDHECINCGECISVCPTQAISWKGSKIFIRGIDTTPATQETEVKPLTALINKPAAATVTATTVATTTVTAETVTVETVAKPSTTQTEQTHKVKPARKRKDRNFWLQVAAWSVALAVLVAALIGFNVGSSLPPVGVNVGDTCSDFTLDYCKGKGEGQFNLYKNRGKITFINFWFIKCSGCEAEMPYIGQLSQEYTDIEFIEIHGMAANDPGYYVI